MAPRILFICGTLELAKSGVADYIHALTQELTRRGAHCASIALHDPHVVPCYFDPGLDWELNSVPVRRLSSQLPWSVRTSWLRSALSDLQPDWISLHYVPYAFQAKGLPLRLLRCLAGVSTDARWELMAHELWVNPEGGLRNRVLSMLQRWILQRLMAMLRPRVVHVTNHGYESLLADQGTEARILPLFSSIPYAPLATPVVRDPSTWVFVVFGAINRDWTPEPLLQHIEAARQRHGISSCSFVSVGNAGDHGASLWDALSSASPYPYPAFRFTRLGELPADRVSEELQRADFGIAVAPSLLIEKSSAVVAMLAHGLPVIISRLSPHCDAWHNTLKRSGHYILMDASFTAALGAARKALPSDRLAATASQFIADLEQDAGAIP